MDNALVNRYMRLIDPLAFDLKLELLSRLSESLRGATIPSSEDKGKLLDELHGSWSEVGDDLVNNILNTKSVSNKEINLD